MQMALAALLVALNLPKKAALLTLLRAFETRPLWRGEWRLQPRPRSMPKSATTCGVSLLMPLAARSAAMAAASCLLLARMPLLLATLSLMAVAAPAKDTTAWTMARSSGLRRPSISCSPGAVLSHSPAPGGE